MQNIKKLFSKLFRDKGYYIALILCIAAVGVSGYLFTKGLSEQTQTRERAGTTITMPHVETEPAESAQPLPALPTKPAVPAAVSDLPETPAAETQDAGQQLTVRIRPVDGEIMKPYSMDRLVFNETTRDWRTHDGVDFAAPLDTDVVAAADGTVEAVFADDFWGQTVTVRHANGYLTSYSNLAEEVCVTPGDHVEAGQKLGAVGQTALAEIGAEPHLHFAVFENGISANPERFLTAAGT